jgi:putative SOS response-associated peptidase YedK
LPVNGFYEWRDINKIKYPYLISVKSNEMFSLGCIYESWVDKSTGELKNTFSILTTPANPLMETIHNLKKRMPLILKQEDEARWVDPMLTSAQVNDLIKPYDEADMQAYTVSQTANSVKNNRNVEETIQKVEYPELI